MAVPKRARKGLWAYVLDHKLGELQRVVIEDQRVSPCCIGGVTNRLAERQYKPPYRWIPLGYRCSVCGQSWLEQDIHV